MENLPNELIDIDTEQQTIDNERERLIILHSEMPD